MKLRAEPEKASLDLSKSNITVHWRFTEMANAGGLDSRLRRRDEEPNASSFTASSSFLYDNDIERHLLFDQVTKLNGITCGLTTSLRTSYKGRNTGTGMMFTIRPSKNIELLTLELPTYENFANGSNPSEV